METKEISSETISLLNLFTSDLKSTEIIPWKGNGAVGFSILKNYPKEGLFTPSYSKGNKQDSVAMIKIGYYSEEVKNGVAPLVVRIHKSSRYLLDGHRDFNFEDKNSPTRESLEISGNSRQPIDLEENTRYELNIEKMAIFDLVLKKYVKPKLVVKFIYELHLKTLFDLGFRLKIFLQKISINSIPRAVDLLADINFNWFGKKIRDTKDFSVGIFKVFNHNDLIDLSTEKIRVFNSDFPITNQTARAYVFFFLFVFLIKKYFNKDIFGLFSLFETQSTFFLAILVATSIYIFDQGFPHLILFTQNCLIRLKLRVIQSRIKIS